MALLVYWRGRCGPAEPIVRAEILARIWNGDFDEEIYDEGFVDDLLEYQAVLAGEDPDLLGHEWDWDAGEGTILADPGERWEFDEFTADLADQLLPHTDEGSLERLFCHFYRGETDTLFASLREGSQRGTRLQRLYDAEVAALRDVADLDISVTIGVWQPRGGLGVLGAHPTLGGQVGLSGRRWLGRLAGEIRLGSARDYYRVTHLDEQVWTDHFFGVYVGLEGGYRFLRTRRHALELIAGLGYDGIQALPADDLDDNGKWLSSWNLNAGLGYRHYTGRHSTFHVGGEVRFEETGHATDGGSDLSGNAWSFRFLIGWSGDKWRNQRLSALHADRWD